MGNGGLPAVDKEFRTKLFRDLFFETLSNQAQYGRWILASLLAVHAGGLLAITQTGSLAPKLFAACGLYLLSGLSLALIGGGLAWINFSAAMTAYGKILLSESDGGTHEPSRFIRLIITLTLWGGPLVAIGSLGLFIKAAIAALSAI